MFWARVDKAGPVPEYRPDLGSCWLWTGTMIRGYGRVNRDGKPRQAHRIAYELLIGPIPHGLELDHLCRVTACVNPDHLEPVTKAENVRREVEANRSDTCKRGHPRTPENVDAQRHCRLCQRIWRREGRAPQQGTP